MIILTVYNSNCLRQTGIDVLLAVCIYNGKYIGILMETQTFNIQTQIFKKETIFFDDIFAT